MLSQHFAQAFRGLTRASLLSLLFTLLLLLTLTPSRELRAQGMPLDYVVEMTATVQQDPPQIAIHWPRYDGASYIVYRRSDPNAKFNQLSLDASDTGFVDNAVSSGTLYEYKVEKYFTIDGTSLSGFGIIASGVGIMTPEHRGRILVLTEDSIAQFLQPELARLRLDLIGDGWQVIQKTAPKSMAVPQVKQIITSEYQSSGSLAAVFLLGHVPVPYSGDYAPDDHTVGFGNHVGAWAADVYYADMTGTWTDNSVNDITADRPENRNVPGDGKFDQNAVPGQVRLELGRVDLSNLPSFHKDEAALLKQYLDKDHRYRFGDLVAPRRALVFDSFYVLGALDIPATNGWRNFSALVGPENTVARPYTDLRKDAYLFSYGCGGGTWFAAAGIGATWDFADLGYNGIFTMIFGSFFGDWDECDNLLRAPLATETGLTSAWAGRPYWYLHHMAMGAPIGFSTMLSQNYAFLPASGFAHGVHVALMGDPTLRVFYGPMAPTISSLARTGTSTTLTWQSQSDGGVKYNVYRSADAESWTTLATELTVTTFTDNDNPSNERYYMLRALGTAESPTGTFTDLSQGTIATAPLSVAGDDEQPIDLKYVSSSRDLLVTKHDPGYLSIVVYDLLGRIVANKPQLCSGSGSFTVPFPEIDRGAYWIVVRSEAGHVRTLRVIAN